LRGNVIPSFLKVLGVESRFTSEDWAPFFLNRTRLVNHVENADDCLGTSLEIEFPSSASRTTNVA
jgi:hypothetical protein